MNTDKILNNLLPTFPIVYLLDDAYFVSDLHVSDGSHYDNFKDNAESFSNTFQSKSPLFVIGDAHDLWETKERKILSFPPSVTVTELLKTTYLVNGNHDSHGMSMLKYYPGIHLKDSKDETIAYLFHGHQIDWFNKGGAVTNTVAWVVEHVWTKFERSPARNKYRADLIDSILFKYANKYKVRIVCGHSHNALITQYYINCGTWTNDKRDVVHYNNGVFSFAA